MDALSHYYHMNRAEIGPKKTNPKNSYNMNKRIKTNIKFQRRGDEDKLIGFVTKRNGSWMGCRETDQVKKKVVILDYRLTPSTRTNTLYQCTLIPMRSEEGFIAVTAKLVKFKARVQTSRERNRYCVKVVFGNKTVLYDPSSSHTHENDIQQIATLLRERVDLEDANAVAEEFINSACLCRNMYKSTKVFKAC